MYQVIMSECIIEHEDSVYEHDNFEEELGYSSSGDSGSEKSLDGENGKDDSSVKDPCAELLSVHDKDVSSFVSVSVGSSARNANTRTTLPVPNVVTRTPESKDSILSDVTGPTELDRMVAVPQSKRDGGARNMTCGGSSLPHDHSILKQNHVIVRRINTYFEDGTYTERIHYSDGTSTVTHSGTTEPILVKDLCGELVNHRHGAARSPTRQEALGAEEKGSVDAPRNFTSEEGYHENTASRRSKVLARDPSGFIPARKSSMKAGKDGEISGQGSSTADSLHAVRSYALSPSFGGSHSVPGSRSDLSPKIVKTPTTSIPAAEPSVENAMTGSIGKPRKAEVVTRTVKTVEGPTLEPTRDNGTCSAASRPTSTTTQRNVFHKTTTYSADGSCVEKMVNADGTTTTIKRSTTSKGRRSLMSAGDGSRSTPTNSSHSTHSSANSTTWQTNRSGRSSLGSSVTAHSQTQGASAHSERVVKSRTTKISSDGLHTEVTEYTDGSRITKTFHRRS